MMRKPAHFRRAGTLRVAATRLVGTAALWLVVPAWADQPGTYAGLSAGRASLGDWPASVDFGAGVSVPGRLGIEGKELFGLVLGRQTQHARVELEYAHGRHEVTRATLGPVSAARNARGHYSALVLNGYRTFGVAGHLNAYAGVGVGWARVSMPALEPLQNCNCFRDASGSGFAVAGRIGMEYEPAPAHRIFLHYTALRLPHVSGDATPSASYSRRTVGAPSLGYRTIF